MTTGSRSARSCRRCSSARPRKPYLHCDVLLAAGGPPSTVAAAWAFFGSDPRSLLSQGGVPLFGLVMVIALPIMFFLVIAYMVVRAQELRLSPAR